jgi:hypothetical protein
MRRFCSFQAGRCATSALNPTATVRVLGLGYTVDRRNLAGDISAVRFLSLQLWAWYIGIAY